MAPRTPSRRPAPRRQPTNRSTQRRPAGGNSGKGKLFAIIGGIVGLGLIALVIWLLCKPSYRFERVQLDEYLAMQADTTRLEAGGAVYVDFSDGMNFGYAEPSANRALRDITNKLAGANMSKFIKYFSLADGKIEPMNMTATQIYNRILAPESFSQDQAPIEKTLAQIVKNRQAALLITDFEEYNGQNIEQMAYAKDYFIQWLSESGIIVFYKVDYLEKGRQKKLFFAMFDSDGGQMSTMVDEAMAPLMAAGTVERFVLGGKKFEYPTFVTQSERAYMKETNGGNYHNAKGVDAVMAVTENGTPEAYKRYYGNVGSATGKGEYMPLTSYAGQRAEFYPIGVTSWNDIFQATKNFSEPGTKAGDKFEQLFCGVAVNFEAQDAYEIEGIEARSFNIMEQIKTFAEKKKAAKDTTSADAAKQALAAMNLPAEIEVGEMFKATSREPQFENNDDWTELIVNFHPNFSGKLAAGTAETDMLRLNIVISQATPRYKEAAEFFGWPGNESLWKSIENTLASPQVNPTGHILWSYFLKLIAA